MAARFAGSRSLDERRRRRIAGAGEGDAPTPPAVPTEFPPDSATISGGDYSPRSRRRLLLQRIIPARLWKHVLAAGIVLAAGMGIVALDHAAPRIAQALGPAAGEFVAVRTGRLLPFYCGVLLAAAAQLALLIWWVRSRSRTDFSGRFHIWRWAAAAGFLLAAAVVLDLHVVWSRTLIWRLKLNFAHCETLCWLAPAVGCGSVLVRDLLADMRNCRAGSTFLWLAVLSWGASVFLQVGGGEMFGDETSRALAVWAAAAFGYYSLFVGLLLHARFVLFRSAEPPEQRPSSVVRALKSALSLAVKPARRAARLLRKRRKATVARETGGHSDTGPFQDSRRESRGAAAASSSSSGRTIRIDEPHVTGGPSGTSKAKAGRSRKKKRDKSRSSS
jgi:hypothetical protein